MFSVVNCFFFGAVLLLIAGGLTGILLGNSALDLHFHDTYLIIAHFHLVIGVSAFFGMFSVIYYLYPKIFRRSLNNVAGYVHFFISFIGCCLIFWPMHYEGFAGQPRRYYDYSPWESFKQFSSLNECISTVTILVFFAQWLFMFNLIFSLFKRPLLK